MSKKRALVVAGGKAPATKFLQSLVNSADIIVAADSGAEHLYQIGSLPAVIVGDYDSCSPHVLQKLSLKGCLFLELPVQKDKTDLEAAIDYCVDQGYSNIRVAAALAGERIDHFLGTIALLPKYVRQGVSVRLVGEEGRFIQAISSHLTFAGQQGTFVSLIPLTESVRGVSTQGLKYPLMAETLYQGSTRGVSNEIVARQAMVEVGEGILLVIKENLSSSE